MTPNREVRMVTNLWRIAWETYKASDDYKGALHAMEEKGMKQPYIDNILQLAFIAGRNSIQ